MVLLLDRLFRRDRGAPAVIPEVNIELIAREHGGKSTLLHLLELSCLRRRLPSGLRFGVPDPLHLPRRLERARQAVQQLQREGLPTTVRPHSFTYSLLDAGKELVRIHLSDAVGQHLTHPGEGNRRDRDSYVERLRRADVLVPLLPCPPAKHSNEDVRRLYDDFLYAEGYLRIALEERTASPPCSLLPVVNRIDVRYRHEAEARQRLAREILGWLRYQIEPLLHHPLVGEASLVPVSAFGFARATPASVAGPACTSGAPTYGEREWLLPAGQPPRPFNVLTLLSTAVLHALRHRELAGVADVPGTLDLCRRLAEDLDAVKGWRIPLKGA
jgi:hypothetical protein